jgi:hypothetical protein
MPYFVKVGAVPENASGVGARGYHLFRRKSRVVTVWGPIEVRPVRRFYWAFTTQHKIFRCGSVAAAMQRLATLIEERTTKRGYSRLPPGAKIRRDKKSAFSTPRT